MQRRTFKAMVVHETKDKQYVRQIMAKIDR